MKIFLKLILILAAILLLSAFLAPLVYPLVRSEYPFERVLSRTVMILGLLTVGFFTIRDPKSFARYGFAPVKDWHRWLGLGLAFGVLVLLSIELFQTFLGAYDLGIRVKWNRIPERLFKGLASALLIGTIEEFFFRGFIFASLARLIPWRMSFVLTNIVYALLHFFHGSRQAWESPDFLDSLQVMLAWLTPLGNWQAVLPECLGLFLFGSILSYAFLKSGGLYLPIGIHAGAVFFLKVDVMFFGAQEGNFPVWLYGGKNFSAGLVGWAFLILFWIVLGILLRKHRIHKALFENR